MAAQLGGKVENSDKREFGYAKVRLLADTELTRGISDDKIDAGVNLDVWMSHGDKVVEIPNNFTLLAATDSAPIAAMVDMERQFYGLQFHPEVTHTVSGQQLIERFTRDICGCDGLWTISNIVERAIAQMQKTVGNEQVILGLSGGVDSSVVAALLHRAIGDQLTCVFVDNGLLRLNEGNQVMSMFAENMGVNVILSLIHI